MITASWWLAACLCTAQADEPAAVPDDAVLWMQWAGMDGLFEKETRLGSLTQRAQLDDAIGAVTQLIATTINQNNWEEDPTVDGTWSAVAEMVRQPFTLFVAPTPTGTWRVGVVWHGARHEPVRKALQPSLERDGGSSAELVERPDCIALVSNTLRASDRACLGLADGPREGRFLHHPWFASQRSSHEGTPQLSVYANLRAAMEFAPSFAPPELRVLELLGVTSLQRLTWHAGFSDDGGWASRLAVETPDGRAGLLGLLDGATLPADALRTGDATHYGAICVPPEKLLDLGLRALQLTNTDTEAEDLTSSMLLASMITGVSIQDTLLPAFGTTWRLATSASVGGRGVLGSVLSHQARDGSVLAAVLPRVMEYVNELLAEHASHSTLQPRFRPVDVSGAEGWCLPLPGFCPTIVVHEGRLAMALSPTILEAALQTPQAVASIEPSGEATPGPERAHFRADLPTWIDSTYASLAVFTQMLAGALHLSGNTLSPLLLPTLPRLRSQLTPWTVDLHAQDETVVLSSKGPVPASWLLAAGPNLSSGLTFFLTMGITVGTNVAQPMAFDDAVMLEELGYLGYVEEEVEEAVDEAVEAEGGGGDGGGPS